MLIIFNTVKKLFNDNYKNESKDFLRGFNLCYHFFEIGFKKNPQYNLAIKLYSTEKELERVKEEIVAERKKSEKIKTQYLKAIEILNSSDTNEDDLKKICKKKTRMKLYTVLFGNKNDSEKINYFKSIMQTWNG